MTWRLKCLKYHTLYPPPIFFLKIKMFKCFECFLYAESGTNWEHTQAVYQPIYNLLTAAPLTCYSVGAILLSICSIFTIFRRSLLICWSRCGCGRSCLLLSKLVSVRLLPCLYHIGHHGIYQRERLYRPAIKQSTILKNTGIEGKRWVEEEKGREIFHEG